MRRTVVMLFSLAAFVGRAPASEPIADDIMREVARRFEHAAEARRSYVYRQVVRSSLVKSSGRVTVADKREYSVSPSPQRTVKTLLTREFTGTRSGLDHDLLRDLTDELVNDEKSRDGIPRRLFPIGTEELVHYRFRLLGSGEHKGRRLHRISFEPADKEQSESRPWKGELWIDAEDLQPVRVATHLNHAIPITVRLLLGTNLSQMGFSATYVRVAPGVWFPATYGTEFRVKVLWGFVRTFTLAMDSSDFRQTDVHSRIDYSMPE